MKHEARLDHCVIHVSDWAASNAFYRDVLGAEVVPRGAGFAYRFGAAQLNCHGPGVAAEPVARVPVPPGGSDLCFAWTGGTEAALRHLAAAGVPVEMGPVARHGAGGPGTSVYFRDPDGSLMEFIAYEGDAAAPPDAEEADAAPSSDLIDAARAVRERAHAPYSGFKVGAAIRSASGAVHLGCNVENVAYPEGTCAEAGAVAAMVAAGGTAIAEVAVISGGSAPVPPCGGCRQKLAEFASRDVRVTLATTGGATLATSVGALLPGAFDASHMDG